MIIIDTDVVSELMRPEPASTVLATRNTEDFADTGLRIINPWQDDADR